MSELSQQEQAFFESGGETPPEVTEAPAEQPQEQPQAEAVEAVETPAEAPQVPAAEPETAKADRTVPLAVLLEERAAAKALKAQLAQTQAQMQAFEQRWQELNQRLNPQQTPPAFEENPAEHLRAKLETVEQTQAQIREQQERAAREAQFGAWYQAQAAAFAQTTPDFMPTYNAFIAGRQAELEGAGLNPQQVAAKIRQEEQLMAVTAAQLGMNPAQMVYQAAIAKGFKPKEAPKPAATEQNAQTKLQAVAEGVKSSKSLSQVPGKSIPNMTAEYVANMSKEEWKKWSENWDENMSKLAS